MPGLSLADLQRHVDRRAADEISPVTIKKEVHGFRAAWNWGRQVACVPADGSQIGVGSEVSCLFDAEFNQDAVFGSWSTIGFAPPFRTDPAQVFHTESPGVAAITASWTDTVGAHSQTFHYTIVQPQH